jgi:hypothetical protein
MTTNTRGIAFIGSGYGESPAEITATYNGNVVFTGEVITLDQPVPALPNLELLIQDPLFMVEGLPMNFAGLVPVQIQVTKGIVIMTEVLANYGMTVINDQTVSTGPDQYVDINGVGECRINVVIDGVAQEPDRGDLPGTWWWKLAEGSTITFDLEIKAGMDEPAG